MLLKPFLFLYSIYVWTLTIIIFVTHYIISSIICLYPVKHKYKVFYKVANIILKIGCFLSAIRIDTNGLDHFPKKENIIVVSNHQSLFDIIVIMAYLPRHVSFFAKKELKKVPILNKDIEKMEHEFVDRNQSTKALEQLQKMGERLKRNFNILLFAEGTRSETGEVLPFKRGAFYLAATTKKNIIPCYIHGTNNVLRKNSKLFYPSKVTLSLGKMIKISDQQHLNDEKKLSKELQKVTYDAVLNLQKKILN